MKIGISFLKIRGYLRLNIGVLESFFLNLRFAKSEFQSRNLFSKIRVSLKLSSKEAVRFFLPRRSIDLESNYKTLNSRHFYFT